MAILLPPKVYLSITKVSFITDNIIGAAQLCNKIGSPYFTSIDEDIARALATYCCISIVHVSKLFTCCPLFSIIITIKIVVPGYVGFGVRDWR